MSFTLLLLIVLFGYSQGFPSVGPSAYAKSNGEYYGEAGASLVNIPQSNGNGDLFYVKAKGPTGLTWKQMLQGTPWKTEVGLVSVDSYDETTRTKASTKFGSAGLEVGPGAMGRASLTEGTVGVGPVDLNMGIGVDTGIIVDRGLEAKFLGIGGKIGADGVQACFILCFGISW